MKRLQEKWDAGLSFATFDTAAMAHDRLLFPVPTHNHRGEPWWPGSEAQRLLALDVDDNKHITMKPRQLYNTRAEYYDNYPLQVFRDHIYQEVKLRKFVLQYYTGERAM
jgi:hypothetical protein